MTLATTLKLIASAVTAALVLSGCGGAPEEADAQSPQSQQSTLLASNDPIIGGNFNSPEGFGFTVSSNGNAYITKTYDPAAYPLNAMLLENITLSSVSGNIRTYTSARRLNNASTNSWVGGSTLVFDGTYNFIVETNAGSAVFSWYRPAQTTRLSANDQIIGGPYNSPEGYSFVIKSDGNAYITKTAYPAAYPLNSVLIENIIYDCVCGPTTTYKSVRRLNDASRSLWLPGSTLEFTNNVITERISGGAVRYWTKG